MGTFIRLAQFDRIKFALTVPCEYKQQILPEDYAKIMIW
jgi:hypothetical protein